MKQAARSVMVCGLLCAVCAGPAPAQETPPIPLHEVKSWGYQLQGLEYPERLGRLAAAGFDMVVVEPMATMDEYAGFDARGMVDRLKSTLASLPGYRSVVLAYVDIGQAEEWRSYFADDWTPPTFFRGGTPDFMVGRDPDGWAGNYPVAYWDFRWKEIVIYGAGSVLDRIIELGFDGIYLDWVEAYDNELVAGRAEDLRLNTAEEMVRFIGEIRAYARGKNPDFLVVPQNAPYLVVNADEYLDVIDAVAVEDLSYSGDGDVEWESRRSGDIETERGMCEWCREDIARVLTIYREAGLPVFTVDYCVDSENAREAIRYSRSLGFVPFVSRTPLDRLPDEI
ncbi:MAG: endo alpha-1,4 polygalactosaminidase [Deltaproteobacteria bacterium]|nr:endo alpha-1,4 polygalactosaminidase [Candidatus Zymogenaceae bacterium]